MRKREGCKKKRGLWNIPGSWRSSVERKQIESSERRVTQLKASSQSTPCRLIPSSNQSYFLSNAILYHKKRSRALEKRMRSNNLKLRSLTLRDNHRTIVDARTTRSHSSMRVHQNLTFLSNVKKRRRPRLRQKMRHMYRAN